MKVTIEKKIRNLEDLRLAKDHLKRKAKIQEQLLSSTGMELYQGLSASRLYHEALSSFGYENLVTNNLPYLLRMQGNLSTSPAWQKMKNISKSQWAAIAGLVSALGLGAWWLSKPQTTHTTTTEDQTND